jgi:hypothetical protein
MSGLQTKTLICAGVVVLILGAFFAGSYSNNSANSSENAQIACADQARKYFADDTKQIDPTINASYSDHWNNSVEKCFIDILSSKPPAPGLAGDTQSSEVIFDAIEGTLYGQIWFTDDSLLPQDMQECEISHDGISSTVPCNSRTEFNQFADVLMSK